MATNAGKVTPAHTVASLTQHAQELIDKCQPDYASKFLERALSMQPTNVDVMDMMSEVYLQMGDLPKAKKLLEASIRAR